MSAVPLREARQAVVRDRVLDGVADLLAQGEDLTYAKVAAAASVPERTVYRYFPTRRDLMTAVVAWVNERTGRPRGTTRDEAIELVRQLFPIFDEVAPVVREVLMAPEGLAARLDDNDERRAAARAVVDHEVPGLDDDTGRRLAAVVQVLTERGDLADAARLLGHGWCRGGRNRRGRAHDALCGRCPMTMLTGVNHVAVLTADLDRFVEFYRDVFELEVVFSETTPAFRHAILRAGEDSWIHPAEVAENAHGTALPAMFQRGHLDHVALGAASSEHFETLRDRLVARGATDGAVEDLGAFHSIWFTDPDGMQAELTLIVDATLQGIHAPRPLNRQAAAPAH